MRRKASTLSKKIGNHSASVLEVFQSNASLAIDTTAKDLTKSAEIFNISILDVTQIKSKLDITQQEHHAILPNDLGEMLKNQRDLETNQALKAYHSR